MHRRRGGGSALVTPENGRGAPLNPKFEGTVGCEQSYWWDTTELTPGPILELALSPIYC